MAKRLPKNVVSMSAWKTAHHEWMPTPMNGISTKKITRIRDYLATKDFESGDDEEGEKEGIRLFNEFVSTLR